jgi:hypothetical protein
MKGCTLFGGTHMKPFLNVSLLLLCLRRVSLLSLQVVSAEAYDKPHWLNGAVTTSTTRVLIWVYDEPLDFCGSEENNADEELMADACGCSCADLEAAASNAHLPCLKKHWNLKSNSDADLGQLILHKVAKHQKQTSAADTEQARDARDCSGCVTFLLEAGVELSTDARSSWRPNALCCVAAAGCVSCLEVMLEKLQSRMAIPLALWRQAVGEALSCLKLDTLRVLLHAAPGDWLGGLQQYALVRLCNSATSAHSHAQSSKFNADTQSILEHLLERHIDVNMAYSCQLLDTAQAGRTSSQL